MQVCADSRLRVQMWWWARAWLGVETGTLKSEQWLAGGPAEGRGGGVGGDLCSMQNAMAAGSRRVLMALITAPVMGMPQWHSSICGRAPARGNRSRARVAATHAAAIRGSMRPQGCERAL